MSIKIYVINNYFFIEDPQRLDPLSDHKSQVKVFKNPEGDYNIKSQLIGNQTYKLADLIDENDVAYTLSGWEDFYTSNTGFNPASGGSGAVKGWKDEVEFFADLPITLTDPLIGDIYLVQKPTKIGIGILSYTTKQSGLWIKDTDTGALTDWRKLNVKVKFLDSEFSVVSAADESKQAKFDMSLVSGSTVRTLVVQNRNGMIALTEAINTASTGVTSFGGLSINADNTKYDIGFVKGRIIDNITNEDAPSIIDINDAPDLGRTSSLIATDPVTFVGRGSGGIVEQNTPFTATQRRSILFLGVVVHSDNLVVNAINNLPILNVDVLQQMVDIFQQVGIFNGSGNLYSAAGPNLNIQKSIGEFVSLGDNYENDPRNPHVKTLAAINPITFRYRLQDSTEFGDTLNIDPDNYDLSGVLTAVPNNKFTIQRITVFSSNITRIQYGQFIYNSIAEAKQGILDQEKQYILEPNISNNGLFRAYLIVKKGATNLQTAADAEFAEAPRFKGGSNTAGGTSVSTMQQAYENSIANPEVATNDVNGAMHFRRATTGGDSDDVLSVQDNAGFDNWCVQGNGSMFLGSFTNATMLSFVPSKVGTMLYNITWKAVYYWDGDVWLTDGLVKAVNANATTMVEGNPVFQDSGTDLGVQLSSTSGSIAIYGVVKDVYGTPTAGANGEFVTVAVSGSHNVLCNGNVIRNQVVSQSSTLGEAVSSGSGGTGDFGVTRSTRNGGGSSLILCLIQPTERF